jgi:DNA repair exonuclease SbcCD ATPase subunit
LNIQRVTEKQGSLSAIQGMMDAARKKVAELQTEQSKQEKQMRLANDMDTVARVFGKEGVAKSYMADMYGLLINACGDHLERMSSNFCMRKDEDDVLSFSFKRLDEPSEWMKQGLLSGGQSIKASVAFLLALQQIMIPEVGLLVLDEPTTHLSASGREGFRDLLEDMRATLKRTECQVIVCDHCEEVKSSLEKKIILD